MSSAGGLSPLEQGGPNRHNIQQGGLRGTLGVHVATGQASHASLKNPLSADFLKMFTPQKKVTRDGQPAKRRGPKPDTKPAMTRRQELNRQAQRTHRERKEQYIRALETEVSRLREAFSQELTAANTSVQQHREAVQSLREENGMLKDILRNNGIYFEPELERRRAERLAAGYQGGSFAGSSTGSGPARSGSGAFTTPATTVTSGLSPRSGPEQFEIPQTKGTPTQVFQISPSEQPGVVELAGKVDPAPVPALRGIFEQDPQLQIDFILTLESPCREHTDYLCRRSITEADDEDMPFSGHALMATCPPPSYIANTTPDQTYPHKTYDLPHANLTTLLNLSRQLVTDGQITPIMALQCLKNHEMYHSLTREDVKIIIETLNTKVRCYGFGACIEDFELMDCLGSVLGIKLDSGMSPMSQAQDDMMYS